MGEAGHCEGRVMQTYRIIPAITKSGEPTWRLYRDVFAPTPFGLVGGTALLAENEDKGALDRAVEHLTNPCELVA